MIIGTPHTKGAGYFLNNKNEPRNRQEADVQSCAHCQAVILMQQWKDNGAWCGKCMKPICTRCGALAAIHGCEPFLKKIEQYAETQMRFEKVAGPDEPMPHKSIVIGSELKGK